MGFTPEQCVEDHWCRVLDGAKVGSHWRARCPLCGKKGAFEISVSGRNVKWNCHTKPPCDHDDLRALLADVLPCRKGARRTVPRAELEKLLGLSDCALRLRVACLAWNVPPKEAAARLGMSRRTYYRAISAVPDVARNRRSAS